MSSIATKTITRRIHPTKTFTSYYTFTTTATHLATFIALPSQSVTHPPPIKGWEHQMSRNWPILFAFAIIGVLAIIGLLAYLPWLFCHRSGSKKLVLDGTEKSPKEPFMPYMLPWIPDSLPESEKPEGLTGITRHLQPPIEQKQPTFVPIHTSLNLVPRSEILNDPERRRGVDEVDLWEKKRSVRWQAPRSVTVIEKVSLARECSSESASRQSYSQSSTINMQRTATIPFTHPNQSEVGMT
ncbi:hypothetical protein G6F47_010180 [Rhizopus delemar]|uniref:Uncharacterized protein n=1 Tax=Rhizopus delemar (strain RA 99-880 / ATCC MYA-4621 / FGSC 9543 / NRRL 43880) TaxID=246409 RepID=I1BTY7_RHIO9|nr:hypothetical protein RO3G_04372 [Rhizopus delemar RA 99-880]KAG1493344.1 hypothetical protein G6F54_008648 [Rhizopus delemar]KAG1507366.1 hypothetical protein G6F53_009004 [Rhizopus delemar]KAG1590024.1 hypothetical protein G6F47_010180 [Rhizopus delemar]|eukprot:EIE79667.1 hypothetical protein RO3G_04372 [Rhizopus delemar RA 99-880]